MKLTSFRYFGKKKIQILSFSRSFYFFIHIKWEENAQNIYNYEMRNKYFFKLQGIKQLKNAILD